MFEAARTLTKNQDTAFSLYIYMIEVRTLIEIEHIVYMKRQNGSDDERDNRITERILLLIVLPTLAEEKRVFLAVLLSRKCALTTNRKSSLC